MREIIAECDLGTSWTPVRPRRISRISHAEVIEGRMFECSRCFLECTFLADEPHSSGRHLRDDTLTLLSIFAKAMSYRSIAQTVGVPSTQVMSIQRR